jgi:hypothetical protein
MVLRRFSKELKKGSADLLILALLEASRVTGTRSVG